MQPSGVVNLHTQLASILLLADVTPVFHLKRAMGTLTKELTATYQMDFDLKGQVLFGRLKPKIAT